MNNKEKYNKLIKLGFKLLDKIYGDLKISKPKEILYDKVLVDSKGFVVLGLERDFLGYYKSDKLEYENYLPGGIRFEEIIILWVNKKYKFNVRQSGSTPVFLNKENDLRLESLNESSNQSLLKLSRRLDQIDGVFFHSLTALEPEYFESYSEFENEVISNTIHSLFNENYEDITLYQDDHELSYSPLKNYIKRKYKSKIKEYWEEWN
jgi:Icc-related predicted phosphoesterase